MHYGLAIPDTIDAPTLAGLAQEAEGAGWDGLFYWDGGRTDPWVALTAAALRTTRLRLGTMVTPLPRQQPWKVASEAATLDALSGGRVILPVGLGVVEFERLGVPKDYTIRARMLDEALDIVARFWSGQPFSFAGTHYRVEADLTGLAPLQSPRIPIWVVGGDKKTQLRRAARWDGAMIQGTPAEVRTRRLHIESLRDAAPLEVITEEETPGDDPAHAAEIVAPYAAAGVTWWMEAVWHTPYEQGGLEGLRRRIAQGPPWLDR